MENIVCNFVSYKINEDALAEIFAGCGISDVCFSDNNGVKVARDNGLIFASENGSAELPQLIFTAWSGCSRSDLAEDAAAVFDSMACVYNGAAKLPCREYTLSFHYSGTAADKLSVLAELFEKTDIADALEVTETRTSAEGMQLACGTFGFERKGHFGGGLSAWRLNRTGTPYNEDSAALLLKDGEFSAFDTDSFTWDETSLDAAMAQAGTSDSPKGATVLKKLSCREIGELTVPPVFLEMAEGALTDCTSLKKVTFTKKNILINRNSIPAGAEVNGFEDSTAERYASENDLSFNKMPFPEPVPCTFEIDDGVFITADSTSVFRRGDDTRSALNDISFKPADGGYDDFDCTIVSISKEAAAASGLTAQLEGFGSPILSDTLRNDRNGYIKVTMMRSDTQADVYCFALEIDSGDRVICMHTEQQFTPAELENHAETRIFARFKQLGSTITFGTRPETPVIAEIEDTTEEKPAETFDIPTYEDNAVTEDTTAETLDIPTFEDNAVTEDTTAETLDIPTYEDNAVTEETTEETLDIPTYEDNAVTEDTTAETLDIPTYEDNAVTEDTTAETLDIPTFEDNAVTEETTAEALDIPTYEDNAVTEDTTAETLDIPTYEDNTVTEEITAETLDIPTYEDSAVTEETTAETLDIPTYEDSAVTEEITAETLDIPTFEDNAVTEETTAETLDIPTYEDSAVTEETTAETLDIPTYEDSAVTEETTAETLDIPTYEDNAVTEDTTAETLDIPTYEDNTVTADTTAETLDIPTYEDNAVTEETTTENLDIPTYEDNAVTEDTTAETLDIPTYEDNAVTEETTAETLDIPTYEDNAVTEENTVTGENDEDVIETAAYEDDAVSTNADTLDTNEYSETTVTEEMNEDDTEVVTAEIVEDTAAGRMDDSGDEIIDVAPEDIRADDGNDTVDDAVVTDIPTDSVSDNVSDNTADSTPDNAADGSMKLVRGARLDLSDYADKMLVIDMDYNAAPGLDIDGYIFLLGQNGKVRSDADLVFFGQKASVDRAVNNHPTETRCFTVELSKLDKDITRLAVAFAIYGQDEAQTFSCVTSPTVKIKCMGREICSYEPNGLTTEKSFVALEIYNKNGWKLRTIGMGYKEALKSLCGSFGVEVK